MPHLRSCMSWSQFPPFFFLEEFGETHTDCAWVPKHPAKGMYMSPVFWNLQNSLGEDQIPPRAQCTRQDEVDMGTRTHCPRNCLLAVSMSPEHNLVEWASAHRISSQLAGPVEGRQRDETTNQEQEKRIWSRLFPFPTWARPDGGLKWQHNLHRERGKVPRNGPIRI
ncbi:hypothetical protein GE21DRAFT_1014887 [Neurospora crassa]|nr:hypothetical protein GE21DRAFT_1014887 [Neurospora crassa]